MVAVLGNENNKLHGSEIMVPVQIHAFDRVMQNVLIKKETVLHGLVFLLQGFEIVRELG